MFKNHFKLFYLFSRFEYHSDEVGEGAILLIRFAKSETITYNVHEYVVLSPNHATILLYYTTQPRHLGHNEIKLSFRTNQAYNIFSTKNNQPTAFRLQ